MDASRRRRPQNHQPRLPLCSPGDEGGHQDQEWRLDDETRQIGLRGVALARARLMGSDRAGGDCTARPDRGTGSAGRAA